MCAEGGFSGVELTAVALGLRLGRGSERARGIRG